LCSWRLSYKNTFKTWLPTLNEEELDPANYSNEQWLQIIQLLWQTQFSYVSLSDEVTQVTIYSRSELTCPISESIQQSSQRYNKETSAGL
jgi:hypothetical protein